MSISSRKLSFAVLVSWLFLGACGMENAPTAGPGEEAVLSQAPDGRVLLSFSPQAAQRAAKLAAIPDAGKRVSKVFDQTGGQFAVRDLAEEEKKSLSVTFSVPPLALAEPALITMTVYGNTLSELVIAFEPAGLDFSLPASLQIEIGRERVDLSLDQLIAWHIHGDGSAEQARIISILRYNKDGKITDGGKYEFAGIAVSVPGFSIYSLGGGLL